MLTINGTSWSSARRAIQQEAAHVYLVQEHKLWPAAVEEASASLARGLEVAMVAGGAWSAWRPVRRHGDRGERRAWAACTGRGSRL